MGWAMDEGVVTSEWKSVVGEVTSDLTGLISSETVSRMGSCCNGVVESYRDTYDLIPDRCQPMSQGHCSTGLEN